MHRLSSAVDVAIEQHFAKHRQLGRLIFRLQSDIWRSPVAPNPIPASIMCEALLLQDDYIQRQRFFSREALGSRCAIQEQHTA